MPAARKRFRGRRTESERRKERKGVILEDVGLSERTRILYLEGAEKLFPIVQQARSESELDDNITQWIQLQWSLGKPLYDINSALCGIQHYMPWIKRKLPRSWKSFKIWRTIEVPVRAAPFPEKIVYSVANFALHEQDLAFAAVLVLGFEGLLRTGELLRITPADLLLKDERVLIRLSNTKTSRKKGGSEVVTFDHPWAFYVIQTLVELREERRQTHSPLWLFSGQAFRTTLQQYLLRFNLQHCGFKPYSLRRGGATALFLRTRSYDSALDRGRWESTRVAKIYIQDALSRPPLLTLPLPALKLLDRWFPL